MTHLHLGCGDVRLPLPWTNVDRRWGPAVDRRDNIGILQHIPANSVTEIYACHCLDHFDRWTYKTVLRRWFDLLKPGGVLRISTPDFEATVRQYKKTGCLHELIGQLYASQDYEGNCRKWCWDEHTARMELESIGFRQVERYEWTDFENQFGYGELEDSSTNYFEAYEPGNTRDDSDDDSRLRSLNLVARKPG